MKPATDTVQQVNKALDGISNALLTFRKLDTVAEDILNITYGTGIVPQVITITDYRKQETRHCILLDYLTQLSEQIFDIEDTLGALLLSLQSDQKTA